MIISKGGYNPFLKNKKSIKDGEVAKKNMMVNVPVMNSSRKDSNESEPDDIFDKKCLDDFEEMCLNIEWGNDYNISSVDREVVNQLMTHMSKDETITETIEFFKAQIPQCEHTEDVIKIANRIQELEFELKKLRSISIVDYKSRTMKILEEYENLRSKSPQVIGKTNSIDSATMKKRTELVESYFEIAKSFCSMNINRTLDKIGMCSLCGGHVIEEEDQIVCSECNSSQRKINLSEECINTDHCSSTNSYQCTINYTNIVLQFQGTFPVNIPENLYDKIKRITSAYADFDVRKISKYDLYKIMKSNGMGKWCKHLHKIHNVLTDQSLPDISRYQANLIKRGYMLNSIYEEIKPEDKSNFMHGLYLLWLFLKNEGYDCKQEDFIMLKSRDVEVNNIETLKKGFKILSEKHPEMDWIIYEIP